jgi:hypothetical protein
VIGGPFTESKEMIAGDSMIGVRSPEEAWAWARRFPDPRGEGLEAEIEVRRVFELDDFPQTATLERFRALEDNQG